MFAVRDLLKSASCGLGYLAFAGLAAATDGPLAPRQPHFKPKVKGVIFLFMSGGPSQDETFDYNPELEAFADKSTKGGKVLPSVFKFNKSGESGLPISEVFALLSEHADDLCLLNGMKTDSPAHPQATVFLHTGNATFVRPSMGAWTVYELGTENQDLPGFLSLTPPANGGAALYGSAFLPATYQGTLLRVGRGATPVENIRNATMSAAEQRKQIDLVQEMNRDLLRQAKADTEIEGLIESYELAF